ncbi:MAG: hypothetical protein FWF63_01785, partial [Fibromonadales bacterium]|nr:hypothetical protein [Fibromonadales bacterium]
MSFELNITIGSFLQLLLQEDASVVVAEVPQKIKMQKACLNFDSREIKEGEIFWALVGKNFNPHKGGFIEEAFKKGAVMAVV